MNGPPPPAKSIGLLLLESGKISAQDAERVLKLARERQLRFGQAAVELGLVQEADIQQVLAYQFDYPYLRAGEGGYSEALVAAYQPFSPQVEALRALRSQLVLRWFDTGHKALALVGATLADGSRYLAANLGIVFSQLGERTLIVDANLRLPQLHTLFNLGTPLGLSDLLAERGDLSAVARIPGFVDLSVLPAGTRPPNPAELLSRGNMAELLATLAERYDVILIDTPPAREAVDFQTVAARAGGALIAVRRHQARLDEVAGIRDKLKAAGAEVVGAVLSES
jgi:chain length determinant protein tyrosine kinase EpsG